MASDLNKHKADILKITGFAFISPLGRVIMQPAVVINEFDSFWGSLYFLAVLLLALLGIIAVSRSYDMLK